MGDFASDTLRDSIVSAWAPSNTRIPKTASAGIEQIVHFLAHPQINGAHEWPIAVEIQKIQDPQVPDDENAVIHPTFSELRHRFTITCRYRIRNTNEELFDQAQEDIEDMCVETVRILKTVYNPQSGSDGIFTARYSWSNQDKLETVKPELIRVLDFEITQIKSRSDQVFPGNNMILVLDVSATTADSKPGSDYSYTEVTNVDIEQGYDVVEELITDGTSDTGVPVFFAGGFSGKLTCELFIKKSDINASTINALDNIYKLQNDDELAEITFLHSMDNTEGTPVTFTESIPALITNVRKISLREALSKYIITASLSSPTTYTVA